MNKVWMVTRSDWESWQLHGLYASRQTAEQWVDYLNRSIEEEEFHWGVEEVKVRTKGPSSA